MVESSFKNILKAENLKLKKQVQELQDSLIQVIGNIKIFSSGLEGKKDELNKRITSLLDGNEEKIKIITPKVGPIYAEKLIQLARSGKEVQIIINDRRFLVSSSQTNTSSDQKKKKKKDKEQTIEKTEIDYAAIYDKLKLTPNIDLINNPNIKFLMILTPKRAVFSAGWLDEAVLNKTVLLGVDLIEKNKIKELEQIYRQLLPTFMR